MAMKLTDNICSQGWVLIALKLGVNGPEVGIGGLITGVDAPENCVLMA